MFVFLQCLKQQAFPWFADSIDKDEDEQTFYERGTHTMTSGIIETQAFSQIQFTDNQNQKSVTAVRSSNSATERPKSQEEPRETRPTNDPVTLSREAQKLSASNTQTPENDTFQQSPFDR